MFVGHLTMLSLKVNFVPSTFKEQGIKHSLSIWRLWEPWLEADCPCAPGLKHLNMAVTKASCGRMKPFSNPGKGLKRLPQSECDIAPLSSVYLLILRLQARNEWELKSEDCLMFTKELAKSYNKSKEPSLTRGIYPVFTKRPERLKQNKTKRTKTKNFLKYLSHLKNQKENCQKSWLNPNVKKSIPK